MGDRVLIQFKTDSEVSPAIYGHWSGEVAPNALVRLRERMKDRPEDISYIAARCLQELGMANPSSTGFGIFNATGELTEKDSQGDNGIFIVTLGTQWKVKHIDGYTTKYPVAEGIEFKGGE
jgi:hypothetical protein